jgi:hypothetical protein
MADPYNPTTAKNPTLQSLFSQYNNQYLNRVPATGKDMAATARALGASGATVQGVFGIPAEKVGLTNLLQMLMQQGRVDPRLLATAQATNYRSTQQQQDAARGGAARSGLGGGGLNQAIQAAIGSAGATRSANLNYQDISDSYRRNQENLGLLDQLVIQPQLGYANLGQQDTQSQRDAKQKQIAAGAALMGSSLGAMGR